MYTLKKSSAWDKAFHPHDMRPKMSRVNYNLYIQDSIEFPSFSLKNNIQSVVVNWVIGSSGVGMSSP